MRDFPRLPIINDGSMFKHLSVLGQRLIDAHLFRIDHTQSSIDYHKPKESDNKVKYVVHKNNRININDDNYFDNLTEEVFNYTIGTYKVLEKYLTSRISRALTSVEINNIIKIGEAISHTICLMNEVDGIIKDYTIS